MILACTHSPHVAESGPEHCWSHCDDGAIDLGNCDERFKVWSDQKRIGGGDGIQGIGHVNSQYESRRFYSPSHVRLASVPARSVQLLIIQDT